MERARLLAVEGKEPQSIPTASATPLLSATSTNCPLGRGKKLGSVASGTVNASSADDRSPESPSSKRAPALDRDRKQHLGQLGGNRRPNVVAGYHVPNPTINRWFNVGAFPDSSKPLRLRQRAALHLAASLTRIPELGPRHAEVLGTSPTPCACSSLRALQRLESSINRSSCRRFLSAFLIRMSGLPAFCRV